MLSVDNTNVLFGNTGNDTLTGNIYQDILIGEQALILLMRVLEMTGFGEMVTALLPGMAITMVRHLTVQ